MTNRARTAPTVSMRPTGSDPPCRDALRRPSRHGVDQGPGPSLRRCQQPSCAFWATPGGDPAPGRLGASSRSCAQRPGTGSTVLETGKSLRSNHVRRPFRQEVNARNDEASGPRRRWPADRDRRIARDVTGQLELESHSFNLKDGGGRAFAGGSPTTSTTSSRRWRAIASCCSPRSARRARQDLRRRIAQGNRAGGRLDAPAPGFSRRQVWSLACESRRCRRQRGQDAASFDRRAHCAQAGSERQSRQVRADPGRSSR